MSVIIPEERLEEAMATLPIMPDIGGGASLKPTFELGAHEDLMRFLQDEARLKSYPYPLVYLETPIESTGGDQLRTFPCVLVLATKTKSSFTTRERLEKTIKYRLKPLLENVLILLNEAGSIRIINKDNYKTAIFYNYGSNNNTEHEAPEIWDAIRLTCDLEVNNKCLQTVNYNI